MIPGEGSAAEGSQRELQHLNSDLLVQVLLYLPQTELFEVMSVCKPWEDAVLEACVLWREVHVCKKWEMGSRGGSGVDGEGTTRYFKQS